MPNLTSTTLSALRHRAFRRLLAGQSVTFVGMTMQSAGLAWLVWKLTGSSLALATISVFQVVPLAILSLPAGALIDRWLKRRTLMVTQWVFLLQALALAIVVFSGWASLPLVLLLGSAHGMAVAFDGPCRRAYLIDLVGKDDLPNAVWLSAGVASAARVVGPSLAGVVVVWLGAGWCFLLNASTYLAMMAAPAGIAVSGEPAAVAAGAAGAPAPGGAATVGAGGNPGPRMGREILEGLRSIWRTGTLCVTIAMALVVMIWGLN